MDSKTRIAVIGMGSLGIGRLAATALAMEDYVAMSSTYPFSITAEAKGKKAEVRITGVIHNWNASAAWFREQIQKFNSDGVEDMDLYIHTPGGSCFEANQIRNEMEEFKGKIAGYGGALVASAGTYIRGGCDTFEMPSNGQWMYHKPMGAIRGNEDQIESELKLLKSLTKNYREEYAAQTGMTEEEIEKRWSKGDVWLNAKEALKDGFITSIASKKAKITEKETAMFTACAAPMIPKPSKSTSKTEIQMDLKMTALSVGLPEDATEAQVKEKLAQLKAAADENATLKQAAKDKETAERATSIKSILDKGITEKKILASQREGLEKWANADFESFKAHVEALQPLGKISEQIAGKSGGAKSSTDKKFEDMSDEEKTALAEEDPEGFTAKYEEYINN